MQGPEMYSIPATTAKGVATTVGAIIGGKVALIVNTASACGFTPQLAGLQKLHSTLGPERFTVVAYPCNQFGGQEPGSNAEIETFCSAKFKTTFPLMDKCSVNGEKTDPLWAHLKSKKTGFLGIDAIKWNFTKFLVASDGTVIERVRSPLSTLRAAPRPLTLPHPSGNLRPPSPPLAVRAHDRPCCH